MRHAEQLDSMRGRRRGLSRYPIPGHNPGITFVPLATMQEMICKRHACAVKAFHKPEKGVCVDEKIDVKDDIYSRSVLLHEFVHYLQHDEGKFEELDTAHQRWQAKEVKAHEIQHKYLKKMRVTRSFIALDTVPITCLGGLRLRSIAHHAPQAAQVFP